MATARRLVDKGLAASRGKPLPTRWRHALAFLLTDQDRTLWDRARNRIVLARDRLQRVHRAGPAVQLGREQRAGAGRDCRFGRLWIHQVIGAALDGYGNRAGKVHRRRGGDHRMRAENHLVPRPDSRSSQREQQSVGGVADAQCSRRAEKLRDEKAGHVRT